MNTNKEKNILEAAKWIWYTDQPEKDTYGEFLDSFHYEGGNLILRISADSNYAAYINGQLAAWGQYADFPYDKVYDEVDVTAFCREGINNLAVLVWYYGADQTSVYYPGNAGLLYALTCGEKTLCISNENTKCRKSRAYISHQCKLITGQMGYSYRYDATQEDGWQNGEAQDVHFAAVVEQTLPLRPRPCDKLVLMPEVCGVLCKRLSPTDVIYDLGAEQVGFLSFDLFSSCEQELLISFGEHLADGCVRRIIGSRDFSVEYRAKAGENRFMNPFRRLGCRYLQIHSDQPLEIQKMAIAPTMYPLKELQRPGLTDHQSRIYDICVNTLRLCMHEHYEDCPWREQALYTMDSRNQMLCGYYAFGEYRFPRANLELISKDNREDGVLSICYPMKRNFVIPSFSLHYITQCREYLDYSRDTEFIRGIFPKLQSIIHTFVARIEDGLVKPFQWAPYWSFYEWTENMSNWARVDMPVDLMINAWLSIALENIALICDTLGIQNTYREIAADLNTQIRKTFWDEEKGIFYNYPDRQSSSQLGNALSILCGAISGEPAKVLCCRLWEDPQLTQASLSMRGFLYDALLMTDRQKYADVVLADIEKLYMPMLEAGSTTVWETVLGQQDFDNAGSLCHGWSAMPIYYYHILR